MGLWFDWQWCCIEAQSENNEWQIKGKKIGTHVEIIWFWWWCCCWMNKRYIHIRHIRGRVSYRFFSLVSLTLFTFYTLVVLSVFFFFHYFLVRSYVHLLQRLCLPDVRTLFLFLSIPAYSHWFGCCCCCCSVSLLFSFLSFRMFCVSNINCTYTYSVIHSYIMAYNRANFRLAVWNTHTPNKWVSARENKRENLFECFLSNQMATQIWRNGWWFDFMYMQNERTKKKLCCLA